MYACRSSKREWCCEHATTSIICLISRENQTGKIMCSCHVVKFFLYVKRVPRKNDEVWCVREDMRTHAQPAWPPGPSRPWQERCWCWIPCGEHQCGFRIFEAKKTCVMLGGQQLVTAIKGAWWTDAGKPKTVEATEVNIFTYLNHESHRGLLWYNCASISSALGKLISPWVSELAHRATPSWCALEGHSWA